MMKYINLAVFIIFVFCFLSFNLWADQEEMQRIREIVEKQSRQPVDEYVVFRAPSYPRKVDQVIPEWQPVEALVLGLPYDDALLNQKLMDYFMTIIQHSIKSTDVVLLVDERELYSFKDILTQLKNWDLYKYFEEDLERKIHIVPARFNTKWIRDYGPLFIRDADGLICIADAVYRDVREEQDQTYQLDRFLKVPFSNLLDDMSVSETENTIRNEDDSVSIYLAFHLRQVHEQDIPIIRVPFQLSGGDIFADGMGNMFISYETLFINGGHREDLEIILKHYYGMKTVTCLETLPGATIKHLDMIFKPIDQNTFLVADYPEKVETDDVYMQYLHREAKRILDNNIRTLQKKFPERRLVKMPMPPLKRISQLPEFGLKLTINLFESSGYESPDILIDSPELWTLEKFAYFFHLLVILDESVDEEISPKLLKVLGINEKTEHWDEYENILNAMVNKIVHEDKGVQEYLAKSYFENVPETDNENISIQEGLKRLVADYIDKEVLEDPNNYVYVYRPYLNSTFLNGPSGKVLLVPSYSGYEVYENTVEQIYKEMFPDTEIVFINSDEIIQQYGTIHCVTLTIPQ